MARVSNDTRTQILRVLETTLLQKNFSCSGRDSELSIRHVLVVTGLVITGLKERGSEFELISITESVISGCAIAK